MFVVYTRAMKSFLKRINPIRGKENRDFHKTIIHISEENLSEKVFILKEFEISVFFIHRLNKTKKAILRILFLTN